MRTAGRVIIGAVAFACAVLGYLYLTLPDVRPLRTANPPTSAFIEIRAREARARGQTPRRVQQWIGYNRISQNLKRAVLVAEDSAFWEHDGVDVEQLRESMEVNWERGQFLRGGSTITQQLAKNLYLSPSRNPLRKLRELMIARRLEVELSKQRILELYLNVIEWGDGIYGAEAAARTYFGVPSSALNAEQSALLAAAIINPRELNPGNPTARLRRRQRMIARRMGRVIPPPPVAAQVQVAPAEREALPPTEAPLPGQAIAPEAPPPGADPVPSPALPLPPESEKPPPPPPPPSTDGVART